jgi:hypothetical protein
VGDFVYFFISVEWYYQKSGGPELLSSLLTLNLVSDISLDKKDQGKICEQKVEFIKYKKDFDDVLQISRTN